MSQATEQQVVMASRNHGFDRMRVFMYMLRGEPINIPVDVYTESSPRRLFRSHVEGLIQAIEREDGSGYSFNLTISDIAGRCWTVYLRCK